MRERVVETLSRFSLEGRRGIVTGGSSGLGLAISRLLADAGAEVFVFSRSGRVKVESTGTEPAGLHHRAVDISDYGAVAEAVGKAGVDGLDFLVNNAGITVKKPLVQVSHAEIRAIHQLNVEAIFNLCQVVYPYLTQARGGGQIVNITSMAAHLGFTDVAPYCSSKAAVLGLTRALAVEWAGSNVRVNAVAPGWFPSEMNRQIMDPERQKRILDRMPVHRYGEPDELASAVLFLVSPAASYITGAELAVDGGALAYGY